MNSRVSSKDCHDSPKLCLVGLFYPVAFASQVVERRTPTFWTVVILVALVVLFRLATYLMSMRRGNAGAGEGSYGYLGGTICPKCGKPFRLHLWSLRLVAVRLDRCPHCKKWSFVNRQSAEDLNMIDNQFSETDEGVEVQNELEQQDTDDHRRQLLDESRFDRG